MESSEVKEGTVLYTLDQFAGKGQRGKKWENARGELLALSIALYPRFLPANQAFLLNMCICNGLCDFLNESFQLNCKIKWPNDIYVGNKKLAGILIESQIMGQKLDSTVAGLGLNINQERFPVELNRATSIFQETNARQEIFPLIKPLLNAIEKRYGNLVNGDLDIIRNDYISRLYFLHESHRFSKDNQEFTATVEGVDEHGRIILRTAEGSKSYNHGEFEWVFDPA
jgi:BirA family biotin operon repressor/biotin-[acetyl-CoA-carboxylase] ligase